jgi:hypothetical protein
VLANRWARFLIPSLSDLFFLAILVCLFMSSGGAGWQSLLVDGDVGWHIRTGEYILDHHSVPHHDLYSFSKPNAPWYAWEWLADLIDGLLDRIAGLKGVVLMAGVVIALFATTLIRRMVWRGVHLFVAVVVSLMCVGSAWMHLLARPHIFTLLLLSISVWMIEADREKPSVRVWWLVPLTAVWTNLHGGFLALIAVAGLTALGTAIEAHLGKGTGRPSWRVAARYAGLTAACFAASLLNPYGYRLHIHLAGYLSSDWIRSVVQEFHSPSFRNENMMQFEALLLAGLIIAGALFRRRRVVEGLWIVFFAHLSLGSARHVPVYVAVVGPVIAAGIADWWHTLTRSASQGSLTGIVNQMAADSLAGFRRTSVWPVMVVVGLALTGSSIPWPKDFPDQIFPTRMIHAHAAEILNARLLTTDQWADYLIYVNPRQKVFVDGRSDFYGPEVGTEYLHLISGQPDWEKALTKYDFDLALLPAELALSQLLKTRPDWRIVDSAAKSILLARNPTPVLPTGNPRPEPRF